MKKHAIALALLTAALFSAGGASAGSLSETYANDEFCKNVGVYGKLWYQAKAKPPAEPIPSPSEIGVDESGKEDATKALYEFAKSYGQTGAHSWKDAHMYSYAKCMDNMYNAQSYFRTYGRQLPQNQFD